MSHESYQNEILVVLLHQSYPNKNVVRLAYKSYLNKHVIGAGGFNKKVVRTKKPALKKLIEKHRYGKHGQHILCMTNHMPCD